MKKKFHCIGIVGRPRDSRDFITHEILYIWLVSQGYQVIVDDQIAKELKLKSINIATLSEIGSLCDLAIVIGGDGNMLGASRVLSCYSTKIIGINKGQLGFLTDLNFDTIFQELSNILSGEYILENRFTLDMTILSKFVHCKNGKAVNEVVLHSEKVAHMIEFEVYIDKKLAFSQRSDGLIISTPTGSTGYSLSAGGPILSTSLEAIVLVPMFPHTLSARPLVISNNSTILLKFLNIHHKLKVSCDSQIIFSVEVEDMVLIRKSVDFIKFIHPVQYNYFDMLSKKLNWYHKSINSK
ncbi:NAD kinase [Buchnera aphidicola (Eriosoma lanigerum)]|uniref:NAD(+) kinase n=1 Tax=Buchnera aphidicola TaxID=9 RepID=UPI0034647491